MPPSHCSSAMIQKCMTPKVRSLDGVARVLLCVELKPCRLHVPAPKMSDLPDLQKRRDRSDEGGFGIQAPKHLSTFRSLASVLRSQASSAISPRKATPRPSLGLSLSRYFLPTFSRCVRCRRPVSGRALASRLASRPRLRAPRRGEQCDLPEKGDAAPLSLAQPPFCGGPRHVTKLEWQKLNKH